MDDQKFDRLAKVIGSSSSRRSILKGLLGLGGAAVTGGLAANKGDARTVGSRPTLPPPPPPPPTTSTTTTAAPCPGQQQCPNSTLCCPTGTCARSGNRAICCDGTLGNGSFPCGFECCNDAFQCCDGECCAPGSTCLTAVFAEGQGVQEEVCCPTAQSCDDQCCAGTCFVPLGGSVLTSFDRECCPASATVCAGTGAFAGQGLCCVGDTPDCCVRDGQPICIDRETQCCIDDDCPDDLVICDRGICNPETQTCALEFICEETCCPGQVEGELGACVGDDQCCTDVECTELTDPAACAVGVCNREVFRCETASTCTADEECCVTGETAQCLATCPTTTTTTSTTTAAPTSTTAAPSTTTTAGPATSTTAAPTTTTAACRAAGRLLDCPGPAYQANALCCSGICRLDECLQCGENDLECDVGLCPALREFEICGCISGFCEPTSLGCSSAETCVGLQLGGGPPCTLDTCFCDFVCQRGSGGSTTTQAPTTTTQAPTTTTAAPCGSIGDNCSTGADCCGGICLDITFPPSCCRLEGEGCAGAFGPENRVCCSRTCNPMTLLCAPAQPTTTTSDCRIAGQFCTLDEQCCGEICVDDVGGADFCCLNEGAFCSGFDFHCCSGSCNTDLLCDPVGMAGIAVSSDCSPRDYCNEGECGLVNDGCDGTIDCGECPTTPAPCIPGTCQSLGGLCGQTIDDGCGTAISCGPCPTTPAPVSTPAPRICFPEGERCVSDDQCCAGLCRGRDCEDRGRKVCQAACMD